MHTDANWAGCHKLLKSTVGGVVMFGRCCFKTRSKTQATIAQRSAESELLATVRGAAEGFGFISLAGDLGMEFLVRLHVDASAALGVIAKRDVGRVLHLDVGSLWIQEQQFRRIIESKKVVSLLNPGDVDEILKESDGHPVFHWGMAFAELTTEIAHFVASPPVKVTTSYPAESTGREAQAVALLLHQSVRLEIPQVH